MTIPKHFSVFPLWCGCYAAKTYHPSWSRSNILQVHFFVFLFLWRCNDLYCIYIYIYIIYTYHIYMYISYIYMPFKDKEDEVLNKLLSFLVPLIWTNPGLEVWDFQKVFGGILQKTPNPLPPCIFMRKNAVMLRIICIICMKWMICTNYFLFFALRLAKL